ncbi:MAG TPA: undecaprenyl diphosphate synthase family protein, partial [Pyrinomonadaceae bacterium]|nr:undecaprenyl diphosphate synthase family protein [Pyrinomonadaceae bacterium]
MLSDFSDVVREGAPDQKLLGAIDWDRLPRHVAIIMDGNGRWAAQRGQPRIAGHRAGVEAVRASVDTGARLGLGALTLYAFSTENWKRPRY